MVVYREWPVETVVLHITLEGLDVVGRKTRL